MFKEFLATIEAKADVLTALSDAIWDHPETAYSEKVSSKLLIDFLQSEGFAIVSPAYGIDTAFTATYGSQKPVIGLLGEFDALSGLSQVSGSLVKQPLEPGANGHGCGHNLLGVGAVAAALATKKYLEETGKPGTVVFYGCPGEEGGSGKAFMTREGAFDNLDCALSWHPAETNNVAQYSSLANMHVLFKFSGTSAHAAGNPEDGRSALDAVELMNVGVNFLREHLIDQARVHYALVNPGGFSPNVVQAEAEILYNIRAPKIAQREAVFERIKKIAQGMAMATETTVAWEIVSSAANIVPNITLERQLYLSMQEIELPEYGNEDYEFAQKVTATLPGTEKKRLARYKAGLNEPENRQFLDEMADLAIHNFVIPYEEKVEPNLMRASTDVGDVSWQTPTGQIQAATWAPNSGGHSWQIVAQGKGNIAHQAMLYCGKVLGLTAMRLFENPDILVTARQELDQKLEGQSYVPLPKEVYPRANHTLGK